MTSLRPGYNLVTDPLDDSLDELSALQFFRRIDRREPIPDWVTVTGLERFLAHVDEGDREDAVAYLNKLLTQTKPGSPLAVQFVIDGTIMRDERVYIKPDGGTDDRIYIDSLFRQQPTPLSASHFWSERA